MNLLLGLALALAASASWAAAPSFASRVSSRVSEFKPLHFNAWRILLVLPASVAAAALLGALRSLPDPSFEVAVAANVLTTVFLGDALFVAAVSRVGASVAVPAAYTFILWSTLIDVAVGVRKPAALAAAALAVAAVYAAQGEARRRGDSLGVGLAVAASLAWTVSIYADAAAVSAAQRLGLDSVAGAAALAAARALQAAPIATVLASTWPEPLERDPVGLVASALLGYLVGMLAFAASLYYAPPSASATGLAATPVLAQVASRSIAGERITWRTVVAAALAAAAIALTAAIG